MFKLNVLVAGAAAHSVTRADSPYDFSQVQHYLDSTEPFYGNISMTVGDASGKLFEYSNGVMNQRVVLGLASGSKWPGVTSLVQCLVTNNVSFDTPLNAYLDWWTKDATDPKSNVTLRHVLSMTTGMLADGFGNVTTVFYDCSAANGSLAECAKAMYDSLVGVPLLAQPGESFFYSTYGFQWAAVVATIVERDTIGNILEKYVLGPAKMSPECGWANADLNPVIGAGLSCSAEKLDSFNYNMLIDGLVSTDTRVVMETPLEPSQYGSASLVFGAYGLGNWLECLNNYRMGLDNTPMPQQCFDANRHGHPGCGGYWNFVDRTKGYYFNFLPDYKCTEENQYCQSPTGDANCPALYGWAQTVRSVLGMYLDDIFGVY